MSDHYDDKNDSLEDINQSVKDVESAVRNIEKAIKDKWSSLQFIVAVFVILWVWDGVSAAWNSKWRYVLVEQVDSSKVTIDKRPHDCDFFSAPLGNKFCHYEKAVFTLMWATSKGGNPIRSDDDGKTWIPFTPDDPTIKVPATPTTEQVFVTWKKVED